MVIARMIQILSVSQIKLVKYELCTVIQCFGRINTALINCNKKYILT